MGTQIASTATRDGVAERCADPAVHTSLAGDLALSTSDEALLRDGALPIVNTAQHHDAQPLALLRTVPGMGQILRLVLLYAIPDSARFPRGQDCASSCRLVTCARESAGPRAGTSGSPIGNAHRTWAFAEAAVCGLREHPAAPPVRARWEKKPRKGTAVTILAHPGARAVSDMVQRQTACDLETCLQRAGRGAGAPNAALDGQGRPLSSNARDGGNPCVCARVCGSRA